MNFRKSGPDAPEEYRHLVYDQYLTGHLGIDSTMSENELVRRGRQFAWILRGWLPDDRNAAILEIGSGYGVLLKFLQQRGFSRLTGVDISEDQVRVAKTHGLPVQQQDGLTFLETTSDRFDSIIALDVIEHFTKPEVLRFLTGCARCLNPSGRIILQTPNAASPWGMGHFFADFTHETAFTPELARELLLLHGFHEAELREVAPIPIGYSMVSSMRAILWAVVRTALWLMSLIEMGGLSHRIMSRSFLITAKRR